MWIPTGNLREIRSRMETFTLQTRFLIYKL